VIGWRRLAGEDLVLYSPLGLRLIDDLTGRAPIGRVGAVLEIDDGAGWRRVPRRPVITASHVLSFPGLGRSAGTGVPASHYRVRLLPDLYRPEYRVTDDGIEFDAPPYSDVEPPVPLTAGAAEAVLLPAAHYPYPSHVPVLRGRVVDPAGEPVADALVPEGLRERVLTDERGAFSLPLRWVAGGVATPIQADDQRNARNGAILVTLPADLQQSQTITVS
jgi:hypothetical protein